MLRSALWPLWKRRPQKVRRPDSQLDLVRLSGAFPSQVEALGGSGNATEQKPSAYPLSLGEAGMH